MKRCRKYEDLYRCDSSYWWNEIGKIIIKILARVNSFGSYRQYNSIPVKEEGSSDFKEKCVWILCGPSI
jgi:hypothetical protein